MKLVDVCRHCAPVGVKRSGSRYLNRTVSPRRCSCCGILCPHRMGSIVDMSPLPFGKRGWVMHMYAHTTICLGEHPSSAQAWLDWGQR